MNPSIEFETSVVDSGHSEKQPSVPYQGDIGTINFSVQSDDVSTIGTLMESLTKQVEEMVTFEQKNDIFYLEEYIGLLQRIPKSFDFGTTSVRLTSICVSRNKFILGSGCGALFIFDRRTGSLTTLRTRSEEVVTCLQSFSSPLSVENNDSSLREFLAIGHSSGKLIILSIPDCNGAKKMDQHINDGTHLGRPISLMCWTENGSKLLSCDTSGLLLMTHIDFENNAFPLILVERNFGPVIGLVSQGQYFAYASRWKCKATNSESISESTDITLPDNQDIHSIAFQDPNTLTLTSSVGDVFVQDLSNHFSLHFSSNIFSNFKTSKIIFANQTYFTGESPLIGQEFACSQVLSFFGGTLFFRKDKLLLSKLEPVFQTITLFRAEMFPEIINPKIVDVSAAHLETGQEYFILTEGLKVFRIASFPTTLDQMLKFSSSGDKEDDVTLRNPIRDKLSSFVFGAFVATNPLEKLSASKNLLNRDTLERLNKELDHFLLGTHAPMTDSGELTESNKESCEEISVLDDESAVVCAREEQPEKDDAENKRGNLDPFEEYMKIFSSFGISDDYSSRLFSSLNDMMEKVRQSNLMNTDYHTTSALNKKSEFSDGKYTNESTSSTARDDDYNDNNINFHFDRERNISLSLNQDERNKSITVHRKRLHAKKLDKKTRVEISQRKSSKDAIHSDEQKEMICEKDSSSMDLHSDELALKILQEIHSSPKTDSVMNGDLIENDEIASSKVCEGQDKASFCDHFEQDMQRSSSSLPLHFSPIQNTTGLEINNDDSLKIDDVKQTSISRSPDNIFDRISSLINEDRIPSPPYQIQTYEDVEAYKVECHSPRGYEIEINKNDDKLNNEETNTSKSQGDDEETSSYSAISSSHNQSLSLDCKRQPPAEFAPYAPISRLINHRTDVWSLLPAPFPIADFDTTGDLIVICPQQPSKFIGRSTNVKPHYQRISAIEKTGDGSLSEESGGFENAISHWTPLKTMNGVSSIAFNDNGSLVWTIKEGIGYAPLHTPFESKNPQENNGDSERGSTSLVSTLQTKKWIEQTSTLCEGKLVSVALTSNHAWYLTDKGVFVQMFLPEMGILYRAEYQHKLSQLTASDHAVWALHSSTGNIVARVGIKKGCPMGEAWEEDRTTPKKFTSISLYNHTGFALDNIGNLWFCNNVSITSPFGSGIWFKVSMFQLAIDGAKKFSACSQWRLRVTSQRVMINVGKAILFSNYPLTGHRFTRVVPERLSVLDNFSFIAAGAFTSSQSDQNSRIFVCQPNPEIMALNFNQIDREERCSFVSIPLQQTSSVITQICTNKESLFVLDGNGQIFKCFIEQYQNQFLKDAWAIVSSPGSTSDNQCVISFAASNESLWTITSDFKIWVCNTNCDKSDDKPEWTEVSTPKHTEDERIDQIRVSPSGKYVWIFASSNGLCWGATTTESPKKMLSKKRICWSKANPDLRVRDLAVGESAVWALSSNSQLFRLRSLSFHSPVGLYWKPFEQQLRAISVDASDEGRLWALDMENRIVRHEMDIFPPHSVSKTEVVLSNGKKTKLTEYQLLSRTPELRRRTLSGTSLDSMHSWCHIPIEKS